jgi:hypothetical protein
MVTDQQMLTAITDALATKAVEGLAESGKTVLSALVGLVRRRFEGRASAQAALAEAEAHPADDTRVRSLREALAEVAAEDRQFEQDLRALWRDLRPHLIARDEAVVNRVCGTIEGNVVQARDVHGGISFGGTGRSES